MSADRPVSALLAWWQTRASRTLPTEIRVLDSRALPADLAAHPELLTAMNAVEEPGIAPAALPAEVRRQTREPGSPDRRGWLSAIGLVLAVVPGLVVADQGAPALGFGLVVALLALVVVGGSALRSRWERRAFTQRYGHPPEVLTEAVRTVPLRSLAAGRSPEAAVLRDTHRAVTTIRGLQVWQDDVLDDHRLRVDLEDEFRQVVLRCARIAELRGPVEPPTGRGGALVTSVLAWASGPPADPSLDEAAATLRARADALTGYAGHLQELQAELDRLRALEDAELRGVHVDDLLAESAADAPATAHLTAESAHVHAAVEAVRQVTDALRADLRLFHR